MSMLGAIAYVDPVSGVIILQAIVAGIVGVVAFFRRSIWRIISAVLPKKRHRQDPAD